MTITQTEPLKCFYCFAFKLTWKRKIYIWYRKLEKKSDSFDKKNKWFEELVCVVVICCKVVPTGTSPSLTTTIPQPPLPEACSIS